VAVVGRTLPEAERVADGEDEDDHYAGIPLHRTMYDPGRGYFHSKLSCMVHQVRHLMESIRFFWSSWQLPNYQFGDVSRDSRLGTVFRITSLALGGAITSTMLRIKLRLFGFEFVTFLLDRRIAFTHRALLCG
jgi:hypothetical protein